MPEYTIERSRRGFSVYPILQMGVTTTHIDGIITTKSEPVEKVFHGYRPSTFDTWYTGDNYWDVDINCGAQRWIGQQTTRQVRAALRKCGFDKSTINTLMKQYKVEPPKEV